MYKIMIDPGHTNGYNPYIVKGHSEGTRMWVLAELLADKLTACGIETALTRSKVTDDPSLSKRGDMAQGYDVLVSLHTNGSNGSARGVEVYHSLKRSDSKLADELSKAISELMSNPDRGAKTKASTNDPAADYYTVINRAARTDCKHILLIESGFHDNPVDAAWLVNDKNLMLLADTISDKLCSALGVVVTSNPDVNDKPEPIVDNTPAAWEKEGVDWAVELGLIQGDSNKNFKLHQNVTRAEFCVLAKRLVDCLGLKL